MTNIESLPLLRVVQGIGADEDWILAFPIVDSSGAPLSLAGISFQATLLLGSTVIASVAGAVAGNIVIFTVLASGRPAWPTSGLTIRVLATGGGYSKDVLAYGSQLFIGYPSPLVLTCLSGGPSALGSVSTQTALNTAAISALQNRSILPVILSAAPVTPLTGGWYLVTTAGLTIPISDASLATDLLIIGDATGSYSPNILISGTINGNSGGLLLEASNQSVTLGAAPTLSSWWKQ
jgi:hypothetical protein